MGDLFGFGKSKKTPNKRQHARRKISPAVSSTASVGHVVMPQILQSWRMRMRVLNLPACPDWRKMKVRNNSVEPKDGEEAPTELEMEQLALEKLKLRRQQSLTQRQMEVIGLRQKLIGESLNSLNEEIFSPNGIINGDIHSSLRFQRNAKQQSISLMNLIEFGMEQEPRPRHNSNSTYASRSSSVCPERLMELQRNKRLADLRMELEEFQHSLHIKEEEEDGSKIVTQAEPLKTSNLKGFTLSLVSLDGIGAAREDPDIVIRIQKMREKELRKLRRHNLILERRLKLQHEGDTDNEKDLAV